MFSHPLLQRGEIRLALSVILVIDNKNTAYKLTRRQREDCSQTGREIRGVGKRTCGKVGTCAAEQRGRKQVS